MIGKTGIMQGCEGSGLRPGAQGMDLRGALPEGGVVS